MATPLKKKTVPKKIVTKTGQKISHGYCRMCMETKIATDFYQAVDTYIDKNGIMSVCKKCLNGIYDKIYETEHSSEKAILRICRMINMKYDNDAIIATKKHLETMESKGKISNGVIGIYRAKLQNVQKSEIGKRSENDLDLTYQDVGGIVFTVEDNVENETDRVTLDQLKGFWGYGFTNFDDYKFLENRLAEWKADYSCSNKAEEFLIKELCFKELELDKARREEKNVDPILKSIDGLLKTASLTPAQTNASSGKSFETIGLMIKRIESTTPAEYYQDKSLFKDFDNLEQYISNFIKRPIMNFLGASKSFEISDDSSDFSIEESPEEIESEE